MFTCNAGENGMFAGYSTGVEMDYGAMCVVYVLFGFQNGLLMMSLPRLVSRSIITHHSAGLKDHLNARRR